MAFKLNRDPANPGDYRHALVAIIFIFLSWPSMLLRFYVRRFLVKSLGMDDYTALLGLIVYTAFCALAVTLNQVRHDGLTSAKKILNISLASGVLYSWSVLLIKLSLGLYFLRVLPLRAPRIAAYSLIIFSTLINFTHFWFALFSCGNPINFADKILTRQCGFTNNVRIETLIYIQAASNMLVDIGLLIVPMSTIWKSMMDKRAKISVCSIFFLAGCGTVCSAVRIYYINTLFKTNFRSGTTGTTMSIIEGGVFIVAGCLATTRVLLSICISAATSQRSNTETKEWTASSDGGKDSFIGSITYTQQSVAKDGRRLSEP